MATSRKKKADENTPVEQHEQEHHGVDHPHPHGAVRHELNEEHARGEDRHAPDEGQGQQKIVAIGVNDEPAKRDDADLTEDQDVALGSLGEKHTEGSDWANETADKASAARASEGWVALPSVETGPEHDVVEMPSVTTPKDRNVVEMESVATEGWSEPQLVGGPETKSKHEYKQDRFAHAADEQVTDADHLTSELLSNEAEEAEDVKKDKAKKDNHGRTVSAAAHARNEARKAEKSDGEQAAEAASAVPVSAEAVNAQLEHSNVKPDSELSDEERAAEKQAERVKLATAEGTPETPEAGTTRTSAVETPETR